MTCVWVMHKCYHHHRHHRHHHHHHIHSALLVDFIHEYGVQHVPYRKYIKNYVHCSCIQNM